MSVPTTLPAATSAETACVAAAKVFDIPELLEHILLHVQPPEERCGTWHPSVKLFTCQCVCKTFKNTIAGSTQLQRQMYLLPVDTKTYGKDVWQFSPVPWFIEQFLNIDFVDAVFTTRIRFILGEVETRESEGEAENYAGMQEARDKLLAKHAHMPTVSWRSIRLGPLDYTKHIKICFEVFIGNPMFEHFAEYPKITWLFGPEATLGDLFDRWCGLLRVLDKQVKKNDARERRRQEKDQARWEKDVDQLKKLCDVAYVSDNES